MPVSAINATKSTPKEVWFEVQPSIDTKVFELFKERWGTTLEISFEEGQIVIRNFPFAVFEKKNVDSMNAVLENIVTNLETEKQQKESAHKAMMEQLAERTGLPLNWD
jgi:hypothetical protein